MSTNYCRPCGCLVICRKVVDTLFTLSVAHMVYTHPEGGGGPSVRIVYNKKKITLPPPS